MYIVNIVSAIKIMTVNKENTHYSMIRQKKKDLQSFSTRLIKRQYLILIIPKNIINLT